MPTPMFPLQTVLFPGSMLPLNVFEPRYLPMIDAVTAGDRQLGVVLIERGSEVGGGDTRCDAATMGYVTRRQEMPDGRRLVLVLGVHRIRVVRWLADDPHPRAETEDWPDEPDEAGDPTVTVAAVGELAHLVDDARRLATRLRYAPESQPLLQDYEEVDLGNDPSEASYRAAALTPLGALDRYSVLCTPGVGERLAVVRRLVVEATELLRARLDLGTG